MPLGSNFTYLINYNWGAQTFACLCKQPVVDFEASIFSISICISKLFVHELGGRSVGVCVGC